MFAWNQEVVLSPTASSYSMAQLTGSTEYNVRLQAIAGAQRSRHISTAFTTSKGWMFANRSLENNLMQTFYSYEFILCASETKRPSLEIKKKFTWRATWKVSLNPSKELIESVGKGSRNLEG